MYGLLCENLREMIISKHGTEMWTKVRELAGIQQSHCFVLHSVYTDNIIGRIAKAYADLTGGSVDEIMQESGVKFVHFVQKNGYEQLLNILGRNFREFLNGLDTLHEYLRFSYKKLTPPSFFVEKETANGMVLHYVSKRKGFIQYVVGQIKEIGKIFYDVVVDTEVIQCTEDKNGSHVILSLRFDNKGYVAQNAIPFPNDTSDGLTLDTETFFDIFPFYILLDAELSISGIGNGLSKVMEAERLVGKKMTDVFHILRPTFEFKLENLLHTNVIFEVRAKRHRKEVDDQTVSAMYLKGMMTYVTSLKSVLFLASPVVDDFEKMSEMGIYVNDLALHDASRDLALQFLYDSGDLKEALDQEQLKSTLLEESVHSLDIEKKRADSLLYRMIPKQVAERLRSGESTLDTCETFKDVTILFSDVVGFTNICTKISPMEVVSMLNAMYTKFDHLSVQYGVYKVETVGDGYVLVSGIPEPIEEHADHVAGMALEMMQVIKSIRNPAAEESDGHLKIRTGIHSGMVVAGVVGVKMPRYCLFGNTVNFASKMESSGSPNAPHISETTNNALSKNKYCTVYRGNFEVKDVLMKTYWLLGKREECSPTDILDHRKNLPIGIQFCRSRANSSVCTSGCQRLLSQSVNDAFENGTDCLTSQASFNTHAAYMEIEKYMIDNDMAIFCSDESGTDTGDQKENGAHSGDKASFSVNQKEAETLEHSKCQLL